MNDRIISFPHLGDYSYFIKPLLYNVTGLKVVISPPITKKTISLGSKYSPDFICLPFKYNLGNYIEALDNGANVLFQFGGGCRYGNYGTLQKTILEDLGYNFLFYEFIKNGKTGFNYVYRMFKEINPDLSRSCLFKNLVVIFIKIMLFDKLDDYRRRKVFCDNKEAKRLKYKFINDVKDEMNLFKIFKIWNRYFKKFRKLKKKKPILKIGIIGELYTAMEPFSTYNLEDVLKDMDISVKRFTDVSFLLIYKKILWPYVKFKTRDYLKYKQGADASFNVYRTLFLSKKKYNGIIHTKPFGCTPEVSVIPIIDKIACEKKMPIMYLSFDTQSSGTGIRTRLEAFIDMLVMRKENKK